MKLKHIFLSCACIGGLLLSLTSCDDELSGTDWAPGEPSNTAGVYFATDNDSYITVLMDGENEPTTTLKIKRLNSNGELTVPVEVKKAPEGVQIPSTVTFASGSDVADLVINCANAPIAQELTLALEIPNEYVNPYAAGAYLFEATLLVSGWVNVTEAGITNFYLYNWSYKDAGYEPKQSKMFHLMGSNRYRIDNFLNTGINFMFEVVDSPYKENYKRIMPLGNQVILSEAGWGDYGYYNSWWLVTDKYWEGYSDEDEEEGDDESGDEETGDDESGDEDEDWEYDAETYPIVTFTKTSNGKVDTIYWLQFMWYDDPTSTEYCYVIWNPNGTRTAYMSFYGNTDTEMTAWYGYSRLKFAWYEEPDEGYEE